jgi:pseudoazurin
MFCTASMNWHYSHVLLILVQRGRTLSQRNLSKEYQMKLYALVIAFFLSTPAFAADLAIEMLNKDSDGNKMVFSQEVVKVEIGDTVTWLPSSKGHNVEMISSPNKMKFKSKNGKEAKITFDTPGIYYYWCTPHKGMGMIGLVVVANDVSNMDDIASAKALGKSKTKLKKLLASLK